MAKDDDKKPKPLTKLSMVSQDDPHALEKVMVALRNSPSFKDHPDSVMTNPAEIKPVIYSTGVLSLDRALGIGGLLGGRIVNCWGDWGTGKTLTGMTVAGAVQRAGGIAAFLDAEGTMSPRFASACGMDMEQTIYMRSMPDKVMSGEDYFEAMRVLVAQGVNFIITDSAAALVPSQKLCTAFGEGQAATQARMMSEELQKLTTYLSAGQRTVLWFTNQMRAKPMVMFGPKDGPTGGNALPFYQSYGFHMSRAHDIIEEVKMKDGHYEKRIVGVKVELDIEKNKTASKPMNPIVFDVYTDFFILKDGSELKPGINVVKDYFTVCRDLGIIQQKSSYFYYGDIRGNGETDFQEALRHKPEAMEELRNIALGELNTQPKLTAVSDE